MDRRFVQAYKEARWTLWLTLAYVLAWCLAAYLPNPQTTVSGLPLWFVLSCLFIPLLFIGLCGLMVRYLFKNMSLEDEHAD